MFPSRLRDFGTNSGKLAIILLFVIIPAEEAFNDGAVHSPKVVPAHLSAATSKEQIRQAFHTAVTNL